MNFLNLKILNSTFILNNSLNSWIISFGIFLGLYLFLFLFKKFLEIKVSKLVAKSSTKIDDFVLDAVLNLINTGAFFFSLQLGKLYLQIPQNIENIIDKILLVIITIIITWIIQKLLIQIIDEYFKNISKHNLQSLVPFLKNILKLSLWLISGIFILSNLGYTITSLAAGLGIGGLAIALAVKPTLESFFASMAIFTDRPFTIGDYIKCGDITGTVKQIGLRTSVVETSSKTKLIVPNIELINSTVENITKRPAERIDASIGVEYGTSSKNLEKAIEIIKISLANEPEIKDDIRVWFDNFGDSALIISFIYFINSKLSFIERREIKSRVNFQIKQEFEKEKIEMAFPSQTIYLKK